MDLHSFLKPLTDTEREAFAIRVGATVGHLKNVAYRQKRASAALAMQIEIESGGAVPRVETRPDDYWLIWPELRARQRPVDEVPKSSTPEARAVAQPVAAAMPTVERRRGERDEQAGESRSLMAYGVNLAIREPRPMSRDDRRLIERLAQRRRERGGR